MLNSCVHGVVSMAVEEVVVATADAASEVEMGVNHADDGESGSGLLQQC